MDTRAGVVLQTFFRLREEFTGVKPPGFFRKPAWSSADNYIAWCKQERVEPLAFMRYRFECAQHLSHRLGMHTMKSAELAENWRKHGEGYALEERDNEQLAQRSGTATQQVVRSLQILTQGMLVLQKRYAEQGSADLCLVEIELSGGFHPKSPYCSTCPMAVRCAAALYQRNGFDVVSLRAGRLGGLPSDVAAAAIR